MALINCPVCGKSVSDKGKDCIYCGSLLSVSGGQNSLNDEIACPECGASMPKTNKRCEICGCPLHDDGAENGKKKSAKKVKKEKVKKEKVKKEKLPKKELSQKEILEKEKKVFNICSIVSLVMSELSLAAAIILPLINIIDTIDCNVYYIADYLNGYDYYGLVYTDGEYIIIGLIISLVCRLGFVAARKIFEKKAQKAERELEKYVDEET